jgi:hypothetical protein
MGDLLQTAIDAHGGLDRWNQLGSVSARLIQGGVPWPFERQAGVDDYDVEINGGNTAAHYASDYDEVAGIRLPTKHRIFPCTPDGQSLPEPLFVSIDLSEIEFIEASA